MSDDLFLEDTMRRKARSVCDALEAKLRSLKLNSRTSYRTTLRQWLDYLFNGQPGDDCTCTRAEDWVKFCPKCQELINSPDFLRADLGDADEFTARLSAGPAQNGRHSRRSDFASPRTVRLKVSMVHSLYTRLQKCGLIQASPFVEALDNLPKGGWTPVRPVEMVPFDKVVELMNAPSAVKPEGVRDRAIFAVMFGSALRREEIVNLRVCDVRVRNGFATLFMQDTKSGKPQEVEMAEYFTPPLARLIDQRAREGARPADPLFVAFGRAKPLSPMTIYKMFVSYAKALGIEEHVTPHSARRTAISKLLDQGKSYPEVRVFSRHASTRTVEIYDLRRLAKDSAVGRALSYEKPSASEADGRK